MRLLPLSYLSQAIVSALSTSPRKPVVAHVGAVFPLAMVRSTVLSKFFTSLSNEKSAYFFFVLLGLKLTVMSKSYYLNAYRGREMAARYRDYYWRKGVPRGKDPINNDEAQTLDVSYKIVDDPYHKRYSVERYENGHFNSIVYDSILLDFRHLKPAEQQGWCKETTATDENAVTCLIRNQEDRLIYLETHIFEDDVCRECSIFSPHGLLLATSRMFYRSEDDATDGVVLFDRQDRPVMYKLYEIGEDGTFTELIEEQWDLTDKESFNKWFPVLKKPARTKGS